MKTLILLTAITAFLLLGVTGYSQPGQEGMQQPSVENRLKMIDEKICQSLNLNNTQKKEVTAAFKEFFIERDKLINKENPSARPEKSKIDALKKTRDEKVKKAIPESKYTQYLELEKNLRPKATQGGRP
jgi:hypothetical protein